MYCLDGDEAGDRHPGGGEDAADAGAVPLPPRLPAHRCRQEYRHRRHGRLRGRMDIDIYIQLFLSPSFSLSDYG